MRHRILDSLDGQDGNDRRGLEQGDEVILLGTRGH